MIDLSPIKAYIDEPDSFMLDFVPHEIESVGLEKFLEYNFNILDCTRITKSGLRPMQTIGYPYRVYISRYVYILDNILNKDNYNEYVNKLISLHLKNLDFEKEAAKTFFKNNNIIKCQDFSWYFFILGIKHKIINDNPNGVNINDNCGSTHLEGLKKFVVENKCNLGIAYDGDGDRCLAVDENGNEIDGDKILAILSNSFKQKGILKGNTVVATVMSNLGLNKYAEANDINFVQTKVGDRYVLEEMLKNGYNLGGEQSGHVICLDYNPTGDGILTSILLIRAMLEQNKTASEISSLMKAYPQVLVNAKIKNDKKDEYKTDPEIKAEIENLENEFSGNGRVLIRASGTEPLIRVMIEGENQEYIKEKATKLAKLIEEKLG